MHNALHYFRYAKRLAKSGGRREVLAYLKYYLAFTKIF